MKIIKEKIVYDKTLVIEQGTIRLGREKFKRQRVNRPDAVAVLVINTQTKKVVLTRQFRYAINDKAGSHLLEIVAGKIEKGDTPESTALRETEEEIGYRPERKQLKLLAECFASPGYTSEKFYIYCAMVTNTNKVAAGGGLAEENEHIEVVEMQTGKFKKLITTGGINDAKTCIAGLYMLDKMP